MKVDKAFYRSFVLQQPALTGRKSFVKKAPSCSGVLTAPLFFFLCVFCFP